MRTKIIVSLFILSLFLMLSAHGPDDIKFVQSLNEGIFSVRIEHSTNNPEKHFINKVEVTVNGKLLITQEFLRQRDKDAQEAIYVLPSIKAGDVIKIKATCNLGGSKEKEFTVQEEED